MMYLKPPVARGLFAIKAIEIVICNYWFRKSKPKMVYFT